jgi:hypothetical protein
MPKTHLEALQHTADGIEEKALDTWFEVVHTELEISICRHSAPSGPRELVAANLLGDCPNCGGRA